MKNNNSKNNKIEAHIRPKVNNLEYKNLKKEVKTELPVKNTINVNKKKNYYQNDDMLFNEEIVNSHEPIELSQQMLKKSLNNLSLNINSVKKMTHVNSGNSTHEQDNDYNMPDMNNISNSIDKLDPDSINMVDEMLFKDQYEHYSTDQNQLYKSIYGKYRPKSRENYGTQDIFKTQETQKEHEGELNADIVRQKNFPAANKTIQSKFKKFDKKQTGDPLHYEDKVVLDINSKLFKDKNAQIETKNDQTNTTKNIKLIPRKFNKHIINHIENFKHEVQNDRAKSILQKKKLDEINENEITQDDSFIKKKFETKIEDRLKGRKYISPQDEYKLNTKQETQEILEVNELDKFNKFNYGSQRPDSKLGRRLQQNGGKWQEYKQFIQNNRNLCNFDQRLNYMKQYMTDRSSILAGGQPSGMNDYNKIEAIHQLMSDGQNDKYQFLDNDGTQNILKLE